MRTSLRDTPYSYQLALIARSGRIAEDHGNIIKAASIFS